MKSSRFFFFTLAVALAALACNTSANPPSAPASPTEDLRLPLMVAETVAAAVTQTAQALPPTFTQAAPSPEPTASPLPTFTPTPLPLPSGILTRQQDGSSIFTDETAGFQVSLPQGWLAVRLGGEEFDEALAFTQSADPLIYAALQSIRAQDPNALRLFVINLQNETLEDEPLTAIQFRWDSQASLSFDSPQGLETLAAAWAQSITDMEITSLNFFVNPLQTMFGVIESAAPNIANNSTTFYKRVYFNTPSGLVYAEFATSKRLKLELIPAFDAIMDTVSVIQQ